MSWSALLFVVFPYVALTLAVVATAYRMTARPFTVSSLSSQLLERRMLFWGSVPFHWGITIILLGHLLAVAAPSAFGQWNREPIRLLLLEGTGLALAAWTLWGLVVLIYRRLTDSRVRVVTTPMDVAVLALLVGQVVTGGWIALGYRYGSYWGPVVFVPYLRSLFMLQPRADLVVGLPALVQLHVVLAFTFLTLFPFTRLVHIITVPLGYLIRPWQVVVWLKRHRRAELVEGA